MSGHTRDWWTASPSAPTVSGSFRAAWTPSVRLWDVSTGQPIGEPMTGHTNIVSSVAFSPDGTRIASAGFDEAIRLWDADTRQPIGQRLTGHAGKVLSVAFSPDGKQIVSGSKDSTVRMWPAYAVPADLVHQTHHQHEPPRMERLGLSRNRLRHRMSRAASPGRRLTLEVPVLVFGVDGLADHVRADPNPRRSRGSRRRWGSAPTGSPGFTSVSSRGNSAS